MQTKMKKLVPKPKRKRSKGISFGNKQKRDARWEIRDTRSEIEIEISIKSQDI